MLPPPKTNLLLLNKKRMSFVRETGISQCLHCSPPPQNGQGARPGPLADARPRGCLGLGSWNKHPNPGNSQSQLVCKAAPLHKNFACLQFIKFMAFTVHMINYTRGFARQMKGCLRVQLPGPQWYCLPGRSRGKRSTCTDPSTVPQ